MDEKTLHTLEYPKILERLAGHCAFSASAELAHALRPTADIEKAVRSQAEASEARRLQITHPELSIGGARDVRPQAAAAARDAVLTPGDLLDVRATLISGRIMARTFERMEGECPHLADIAARIPYPVGLVDAISRTVSERGDVLDSASENLGAVRKELRVVHDRLLTRMQRMVGDASIAPYLQEALVTQRDGRYVLPLRAEFKGRIKAIIHDQSSSGATLFVEPLTVVDQNNRYRELQLAERDEERRVLAELSRLIGERAAEVEGVVETLAELDLALARGRYAEQLAASEPELLPFKPRQGRAHPGSTIRLWQARHPLLDQETVVPVDVALDPRTFALVITGPNTGGKTVTLKTVGLLALMAQSGLHLPAQAGSQLSVFATIFADIGDEQSIEQSLSTFSGHIRNIIRILAGADRRSLVILDELGAGTDPQEGAALARALLGRLLDEGVTTMVATHYPELKAYAHTKPGVVNASVEFDLETLSPTFHLTIGLPGRSNALSIAERLGLQPEIVEAARAGISPTELRAEDLLDEIHRQRDLAHQARAEAERARQESQTLRAELAERLENIEDERRAALEDAREEGQARLAELQAELERLRGQLARARQPLEALQEVARQVEALEEELSVPAARARPALPAAPPRRALRLGDRVRLPSLDAQGLVTALGEEEAEVQVGVLRVRARLVELELVGEPQEEAQAPQEVPSPAAAAAPRPSPGLELDLRGQTVDQALESLDRYLDSAYLASMPFVRLIHGKGTGRLRSAVRQELRGHPHVASFEQGLPNEGGEGVTVARLKAS